MGQKSSINLLQQSVISAGYRNEVKTYFDAVEAVGGYISPLEKRAFKKYVKQRKLDGTWGSIKVLYPYLGRTPAATAINAKNPSEFTITWYGNLRNNGNHSKWGIHGDGVSDGLNGTLGLTNFIPRDHLADQSSYILLSHHSGDDGTSASRTVIGCNGSDVLNDQFYASFDSDRDMRFNINSGNPNIVVSRDNMLGILMASRTTNISLDGYIDGTIIGTQIGDNAGKHLPETQMAIMCRNNANSTYIENFIGVQSYVEVGDGVIEADALLIQEALKIFLQDIGRYVHPDTHDYFNSNSSLYNAHTEMRLVSESREIIGASAWGKLDVFNYVSQKGETPALTNLIDPTVYGATNNGAVYGMDGLTTDGSSTYLDSNWNLGTSIDDGLIGVYIGNPHIPNLNEQFIGSKSGTSHFKLGINAGNKLRFKISSSELDDIPPPAIVQGMLMGVCDTTNTLQRSYLNRTLLVTKSTNTSQTLTEDAFIGCENNTGSPSLYSSISIGGYFFGHDFTVNESLLVSQGMEHIQRGLGRSGSVENRYTAESQAYFNTIEDVGGYISESDKVVWNNYVITRKTDNTWDDADGIYPYLGTTPEGNSINAYRPDLFKITWNGILSEQINHTQYGPQAPGASTGDSGDTGFNPTTQGYSAYDTHMISCARSADPNTSTSTATLMGGGAPLWRLFSYNGGLGYSSSSQAIDSYTNQLGIVIGSRIADDDNRLYLDGTEIKNIGTTTSTTLFNSNLFLFAKSNIATAEWHEGLQSYNEFGTGISPTKAANIHTALKQLMIDTGRYIEPVLVDYFVNGGTDNNHHIEVMSKGYIDGGSTLNTAFTTKTIALWPMIGDTSVKAQYNAVDPTINNITEIGTPTYDAFGYHLNGTTDGLNTDVTSSELGNSARELCLGLYHRNILITTNSRFFGFTNGGDTTEFRGSGSFPIQNIDFRIGANNISSTIGTFGSVSGITSVRGQYMTGAGSLDQAFFYNNGTLIETVDGGLGATTEAIYPFYIGCKNNIGVAQNFSEVDVAGGYIGDAYTEAEGIAIDTFIEYINEKLGRSVVTSSNLESETIDYISDNQIFETREILAADQFVKDAKGLTGSLTKYKSDLWTNAVAYCLASPSNTTAVVANIRNSAKNSNIIGTPILSTLGLLHDGSTDAIDSTIILNDDLTLESNVSVGMMINNSTGVTDRALFGGGQSGKQIGIVWQFGPKFQIRLYDTSQQSFVYNQQNEVMSGLITVSHNSNDDQYVYTEDTLLEYTNIATNGTSAPTYSLYFMGFNNMGSLQIPTNGIFQGNFILDQSLTSNQMEDMNNMWQRYQQNVSFRGRNVIKDIKAVDSFVENAGITSSSEIAIWSRLEQDLRGNGDTLNNTNVWAKCHRLYPMSPSSTEACRFDLITGGVSSFTYQGTNESFTNNNLSFGNNNFAHTGFNSSYDMNNNFGLHVAISYDFSRGGGQYRGFIGANNGGDFAAIGMDRIYPGNILLSGHTYNTVGDTQSGYDISVAPEVIGDEFYSIPTKGCLISYSRDGTVVEETYAAKFTAANSEYLSSSGVSLKFGNAESFSWGGWFRCDNIATPYRLGGSWTNGYVLRATESGGNIVIAAFIKATSGTHPVSSAITIPINTWFFAVQVYDFAAGLNKVSVNGETLVTIAHTDGTDANVDFRISGNNEYLDGDADSCFAYNKALSQAEVEDIYNSGTGQNYLEIDKTLLLSFWALGETSETRADSHGSNDLKDNATVTQVVGHITELRTDPNSATLHINGSLRESFTGGGGTVPNDSEFRVGSVANMGGITGNSTKYNFAAITEPLTDEETYDLYYAYQKAQVSLGREFTWDVSALSLNLDLLADSPILDIDIGSNDTLSTSVIKFSSANANLDVNAIIDRSRKNEDVNLYTSDFSTSVDTWTLNTGLTAISYNETINSSSGWLSVELDGSSGAHYFSKEGGVGGVTEILRARFTTWMPTGDQQNGFLESAATGVWQNWMDVTQETEVSFDYYLQNNQNRYRFWATKDGNNSYSSILGEKVYIKNVILDQVQGYSFNQTTAANKPHVNTTDDTVDFVLGESHWLNSSDFATSVASDTAGMFTIMMRDDLGSGNTSRPVDFGSAFQDDFNLYLTPSDELMLQYLKSGSNNVKFADSISRGGWMSIQLGSDGSNYYCYLNGVLQPVITGTDNGDWLAELNNPITGVRIGKDFSNAYSALGLRHFGYVSGRVFNSDEIANINNSPEYTP